MEQVRKVAVEHNARRVDKIFLRIGPLSGIEASLLKNAFPIAATGTVAEDAVLVIEQSEIVVRCTQCDTESTVTPNNLLCRQCGDFRTRLISGDAMLLERLELDIAKTTAISGAAHGEAVPAPT
jgi:hydrogenase nickel incorporation protein HypA/HybF